MDDTAQPLGAAETDPIASAAAAFKASVPELVPTRPRDEQGKFVSTKEDEEEIEVPEAIDEVEEGAESPEEVDSLDEAADEAQPDPVDLPPSWPAELAEDWQTLPAAVQDKIVAREAEREAAVNAKFQEAANVRKANEATIAEAKQSAQQFAQMADYLQTVIQPNRPPLSMLTPGSHDYNPDHYHLLNAQADEHERLLSAVKQHREQAVAQLAKEAEAQALEQLTEVEHKSRPALLRDVPELSDPAKQPAVLNSIVQYAVEAGIPQDVFTDPDQAKFVTSAQLHLVWKAQQYDKMKVAQTQVKPKAARPAAPVVKPGVATTASSAKAIQQKNVRERLAREGSVEAGAAFFKSIKF
jgi:hypothetical protein